MASQRNRQSLTKRHRQQGVALILFLTLFVLALTTVLVTQTTPNQRKSNQVVENARVLNEIQQALIGFSLRQAIPGALPCPDSTGDGVADPQGASCDDQLGLVPFRTLDLDDLTDSTGAAIWYAVSLDHLANAATAKNSSLGSSLTVDGVAAAAVLIAPGPAVDGQDRVALNVGDYLEGINADANRDDYESVLSTSQNDQLLTVPLETLWPLVEVQATATAVDLLTAYRVNCGEYPWAAAFGGGADSVAALQTGALPLGVALPFDWGAACGLGTAPGINAWLANHWQDQMFFRMCTALEGSCLTVLNEAASPASALVVAPGVELATQSRPSGSITDYFEDENSDGDDTEFTFQTTYNYSATFNDTVSIVP